MECDDLKEDLCMLGNCIRDKVRCCALCVDRDMCIECCDLVRCDDGTMAVKTVTSVTFRG